MRKVAFLDVDGVIRHNNQSSMIGKYYVLSYNDVYYIDGALEAHKLLHEHNIPVYWVTMQNCIIEGKISYYDVMAIFEQMVNDVIKYGGYVDDVLVCTTLTESHDAKAVAKYEAMIRCKDVDFSRSLGVGDSRSDILAFSMVGIKEIYHIPLRYREEVWDYRTQVESLLVAVKTYLCIP